ncbi:hypothetical protein [Taibaiella koreensis]|uniref:hypothetical protein n=1 Tax=Taibaiella koreensis TaxID=1268548 RepID=UPI000E59CE87|nr:hypothetical protein [Taibaiella koreensis]
MMKQFLVIGALLLGNTSFGQNQQQAHVVEADNLSEAELQHLNTIAPKDGWVLVKYKGGTYIENFSNKDYMLSLFMQCADATQTPGYLIEYSNEYGDKEMGGLDFLNSSDNHFAKVIFYLDGKSFGDPFSNIKSKSFTDFYQAVKTAQTLKIEAFDEELNPDTGKQELRLNRGIDFKLANGALLDKPVTCR